MRAINYFFILGLSFSFLACQSTAKTPKAHARAGELAVFEKEFIADLFALNPRWGSQVGAREYDTELPALDKAYLVRRQTFVNTYRNKIGEVRKRTITADEAVDLRLVENFIDEMEWDNKEFKRWQWDPAMYNVADSIAILMESKMTESDREKRVVARLEKVPAYYQAAIENLERPTKELLQLAIKQNKGTLNYLHNTVQPAVQKMADARAVDVWKGAYDATADFVKKLEKLDVSLQKKNGFRSFRIGPSLYRKKFAYDVQVETSPEAVYAFALQEKARVTDEMAVLAKKMWTKYFPKTKRPKDRRKMIGQMVHHLAEQHAKPEEFFERVRAQLPQLWDFVEEKNLLTMDRSQVLTVRTTPEYEQGFAIASVDAPGPFDPERPTYYNVTPVDKMDPAKVESFLKEYNDYTLQILNIHEAIPGHYAQLVYSKKSPSLIKSILGNGAMVEGWAVYAERMMMESGYGDNQPELWLMYHKWYLRVVSNMIIDYEIHNKNLSRPQFLRLLVDESFQEQTEAEYKWDRATYSQVQLTTYFAGFSEIYRFREELKKSQKNFQLRAFNEKFLSYGSAPIREIMHMMKVEAAKTEGPTTADETPTANP